MTDKEDRKFEKVTVVGCAVAHDIEVGIQGGRVTLRIVGMGDAVPLTPGSALGLSDALRDVGFDTGEFAWKEWVVESGYDVIIMRFCGVTAELDEEQADKLSKALRDAVYAVLEVIDDGSERVRPRVVKGLGEDRRGRRPRRGLQVPPVREDGREDVPLGGGGAMPEVKVSSSSPSNAAVSVDHPDGPAVSVL